MSKQLSSNRLSKRKKSEWMPYILLTVSRESQPFSTAVFLFPACVDSWILNMTHDPILHCFPVHPPLPTLRFKSHIGDLKALRTEIQHVQLLMERAKVQLQKDFKEWWREETPGPQVTDALAPMI